MQQVNLEDTIAAVATPAGEGGIAVIRVSGPKAVSVVQPFFRSARNGKLEGQPTHTIHHGIFSDEEGNVVDEVLISLFRSPNSYTGEDVVEISCHGGMKLVSRILDALIRSGARQAGPGEFTKRAFLNGKIDLTQAEAVLDLIRAKSDASLEAAVSQLQGRLSKKINALKDKLLNVYAHMEASLDFPDERLDTASNKECLEKIEEVEHEIESLIQSFKRGAVLREGLHTVIIGKPNVGKSSLLNALLEKDRALVSHIPGTTRDTLEEQIEIAGVTIRLADTAGLALKPHDELDRLGIERTRRHLKEADLLLFVVDGSTEWSEEDETVLQELDGKNILWIVNKIDLQQRFNPRYLDKFIQGKTEVCFVSCLTGRGIPALEKSIAERIKQEGILRESSTLTRLRHKQALDQSLQFLHSAEKGLREEISNELILEDLKSAFRSLQELIGEIYSENLLDVIFSEFCIGK